VICRRFCPSRSITKICSFPARVDVKATWRPFGENAGLSLLPMPSVTARAPRFVKSKILMSKPAPVRDAYAISLNGAGYHVGLSHQDSLVIRCCSEPSAFMIQICGNPLRFDVNAICVPVGDHVGVTSFSG